MQMITLVKDNQSVIENAYSAAPAISTSGPLHLSLQWIKETIARDSEIASLVVIHDSFQFAVRQLEVFLNWQEPIEAESALEVIIEEFALIQAEAFRRRIRGES